jgi:RNA polymerase sigma-70 factor (ECF subfamily)
LREAGSGFAKESAIMSEALTTTAQMQLWIDRLQAGDQAARDRLIDSCCARLLQLTRKMLRRYPRVKRWEQTDDVLQNVVLRLRRTLTQVTPATVRDFLRLASLNIRRELLDLVKHYYGPRGLGSKYLSDHGTVGGADTDMGDRQPEDVSQEPARLAQWTEFHVQVDKLPQDEREVFDLLWYQGLSQAEAAALLEVTERTVQRRWQSARLLLFNALGGELPPGD